MEHFGKTIQEIAGNNPFAESKPKKMPAEKPGILDLEPVKAELARIYRPAMDQMVNTAEQLNVTSRESEAEAVSLAGKAKKLKNELEAKRKEFTKDARDYTSAVNRLVKSFAEDLGRIEGGLKSKIVAFRRQQEMERRKAEAAARKAREEAQKRLEAEAKEAGVEPVELPEPIVSDPPKVTRTESGSAYTKKRWTFAVVDTAQVPPEYLVINTKAVNAAIRAGVREIPGLRIYQEETVAIRS